MGEIKMNAKTTLTADLVALRELAENATPGKRQVQHVAGDIGICVRGPIISGYMAFMGFDTWHQKEQKLEQKANADFIAACDRETILSLLSQISALQGEVERLRVALETVRDWDLPRTLQTWEDGTEKSYSAAFGSNGERDYMKGVARKALAAPQQREVDHG